MQAVVLVAATLPFRNPSLPLNIRAADLMARLTRDEKVSSTFNHAPPISRLGIPAYKMGGIACQHGVAVPASVGGATIFPTPLAMAASFNTSLLADVASAVSTEMRALFNAKVYDKASLVCMDPNVNIVRDPRWGRNLETYGEDPTLTSRMAVAFVGALQASNGSHLVKVGGGCKHFAGYSLEQAEGFSRFDFDAHISAKDAEESYLPAFRACADEARSLSVMCSCARRDDRTLLSSVSCEPCERLASGVRLVWLLCTQTTR